MIDPSCPASLLALVGADEFAGLGPAGGGGVLAIGWGQVFGLVQLLVLGLAVLLALVLGRLLWMFTHPPRRTYAGAVARNKPGDPGEMDPPLPFEAWVFRGKRHELPVWEIPGEKPDGPTVVITHGWSDARMVALERVPIMRPFAARVILWDQPGHGEAPGICRLGTAEAEDLIELIDRVQHGPGSVVIYGFSMGAGITIDTAARLTAAGRGELLAAVVAEAPYNEPATPARNVLRELKIPDIGLVSVGMSVLGTYLGVGPRWRGYSRAELAATIRRPFLVLHGDQDPTCPTDDGRTIAEATPDGRFVLLPGGDHTHLWSLPETAPLATEAMHELFREIGTPAAPAQPTAREPRPV